VFISRCIQQKPQNILDLSKGAKTLNLVTLHNFYKLGFFSRQLQTEITNNQQIALMFPQLKPFLPKMIYNKGLIYEYVQLEKYQHLERDEMLPIAFKVLEVLRRYGKKQNCDSTMLSHINRGIRLIGILYGKKTSALISQNVTSLLARSWTIGPVHGDFHTANLLKNTENFPKIIDLDNFSDNGIQALDAFNFIIDYEVRHSNQKWYEILQNMLINKSYKPNVSIFQDFLDYDVDQIALLYCMNRLGYENSYYHLLSRSVYKEYLFIRELAEKMESESLS
jgi:hypothetical protein